MADVIAMLSAVAGAAGGAEPDPYFNYTTLLLPGNGTNGAQNNTFLDSSTNNFTITRYGNTTQGTFSPFSQTGWSNYFDGSGDYLTFTTKTFASDFTAECWVYKTATDSSGYTIVFGDSTQNTQLSFDNSTSGAVGLVIAGNVVLNNAGTAVVANQWNHLAWVRQGSTCRIYVNGVQQGSASNSSSMDLSVIGRFGSGGGFEMNGYISNARLTNACLYPDGTTFTPSTTPLTTSVSTGTVQLLTCQSNRFVDNSASPATITAFGNSSVQAFSPFAPTAEYDPAVNGGSGYFDGTGDSLYTSGANLVVGTGTFTLEWWLYLPTSPGSWAGTVNIGDGTWNTSGRLTPLLSGGATYLRTSLGATFTDYYFNNAPIRVGQWNHMAIQRETSGTVLAYCNGYVATSGSLSGSGVNLTIDEVTAGYSDQGFLQGYLSNIRLTRGSAVYGSTYTVPTSPVTGGSLLLNFTNAGITDATAKNDLETVGNAQISNGAAKFGSTSMYFDGTGDYLRIRHSPEQQFGTGDFTFEAWIYPTAITGTTARDIICKGQNASGSFEVAVRDSKIRMYTDVVVFTSTASVTVNTWQHIAITRSGTTLRFFLDGVLDTTVTSFSTNFNETADLFFGSYGNGSQNYYTGFLEDVRITKGVARYTSNFTPPTKAFPLL